MIYFVQRANGDIKIGTTKHLQQRLKELGYEHGAVLLLGYCAGSKKEEIALHKQFSEFALGGEFFAPSQSIFNLIRTETTLAPIIEPVSPKQKFSAIPVRASTKRWFDEIWREFRDCEDRPVSADEVARYMIQMMMLPNETPYEAGQRFGREQRKNIAGRK